MSVQEIQDALERAMGRRKRLAAARAAVGELTDDEHDELLAEMVESRRRPKSKPAPQPVTQPVAPPLTMPSAFEVVTEPLKLETTSGETPAFDGGSIIKDAIATVMADGKALTTGGISDAVIEKFPSIKRVSIPAAVARMAGEKPPKLIKRGKGPRGAALYVLAPTEGTDQ